MGSWGPKLYQDDLADEVRSAYKDQLKRGKTNDEVAFAIIDEYRDAIADVDDAPVFWFALADTQWELGRLLPDVKKSALEWLEKGSDLEKWEMENPKEAKIRKEVLEDLRQRLNSSMPAERKISVQKLYRCEWKIGDVFAYVLDGSYAEAKGLYGMYVLIQKVDEYIWHPGHIIPIVYWRIMDRLPVSFDDVDDSKYILRSQRNGLNEYRRKMISTSKKIIPKKIVYIGNYPNLRAPDNELLKEQKISYVACQWSALEKTAIDSYVLFSGK